ncbi:MAG TPA: EAL domain-containing protein [Methylomirabilota bacterium]|jgi:EAL domain-containing protein (putative c-di-GMP-specific phosphodiesterase class I)|nr:EAL domain-containing protein [Methylomirabilota bacterium]
MPSSDAEAARPRGRVLVVDDERDLLEILGAMLTEVGWHVDTAPNGRAALVLVDAHRYDVVLSDIDMPGINGVELLREIRARDLDVPVLLITGHPRVETAVEALEHGALRYLQKPLRERDLLTAVEDAARLHRMARLKREALAAIGLEDRLPADRAGLETRFNHALATVRLVFQPILRAADGTVFGYEALVRTEEPSIPSPGALFEAAERLGRVHEVGGVVRDRAAAFLTRVPSLTLFVNLHALELMDDSLLSPAAALSGHAKSVVLELTERSSFEHVPNLRARVSLLRRLGYRLAVDDLGAGYAGLNSFAALNPHVVKLDMTLVRGADREPVKQRVIGSMASLCREFGIMVVAEGIETPAERDTVISLGCDLIQGYLLGRPMELDAVLAAHESRPSSPGGDR